MVEVGMVEVCMVCSVVLTFFLSLGWVLRSYIEELKRVTILLNRTREEVAKEYVTKSEVHAGINQVITRLEALDVKLDRMIEGCKRS